MTVTVAQHKIDTTSGSSPWTSAFSSNMSAGNVVVAILTTGFNSPTPTVTDPGTGDTYTVTAVATDTPDGQFLWACYKVGVAGSQTTLTFTSASNVAMSAALIELHSTSGWTGFRNSASGGASVAGTAVACSSSLGAAGDAIVAGSYDSTNGTLSVSDGALTMLDNQTSGGANISCSSWLASASGAVTPSYSCTQSGGWAIWAVAFTPASGVVFIPPHRPMRTYSIPILQRR